MLDEVSVPRPPGLIPVPEIGARLAGCARSCGSFSARWASLAVDGIEETGRLRVSVGRRFDRALVVFAHPDDGEFGTAGTVATWTRAGTEVTYVCVTDGSAGSNEPGATREGLRVVREAEQRAACEVLGVKECVFLGLVDGMGEVRMERRRAICREVR